MMEKEKEVNKFLPQRFHKAEDLLVAEQSTGNVHVVRTISSGLFSSIEAETANIVRKISDLKRGDEDEKILMLRGSYGCGKTTFLRNIVDEIVKTKVFLRNEIWCTSLDQYSTLESMFYFLAGKADHHGMREQHQILLKATESLDERKQAANKVLFHCKFLLIEDIDSSKEFDYSFLKYIANKEIIILCTCTNPVNKESVQFAELNLPKCSSSASTNTASPLPGLNEEQIQEVMPLLEMLGPFYTSVLVQAISAGCVTFQSVSLRAKIPSTDTSSANKIIEAIFAQIFSTLRSKDKLKLINLASTRIPLPIKTKDSYEMLLKLGLIEMVKSSDGKMSVKLPHNVMMIMRELYHIILDDADLKKETEISAVAMWKDVLPEKLQELLKLAENHTWPFVPEAWQYKDVVGEEERYNLKDVIHKKNEFSDLEEIDILQECLYAALINEDYKSASALIFIMDRFVYWQGTSSWVIKTINYIQKISPRTAIAPQLIIRKARLMKNNGDIQGAEKVLNTLIKNEENLGHWIYESSADYLLVSSVCIQIKGDILRGLGLWVEAAKALIKSIVGFRTLPKEDIKGWGSSLSLLADAFQYMALEDFKKDIAPYYKLISPHPVLEAIQCVNEAANLSIYSPLFYTKNKRRAGELMLIYSRILPNTSTDRYYYIMYAVNELTEGLSCHTSIASLESREQFYEFVFSVYNLSQVITEMSKVQYGPDTTTPVTSFANVLFSLACQLYDHYCSFEKKVQHNEWSSLLIQTTLQLLNLRKIPATENPQKPAAPQPIKSLKELDKSYLPSDKSPAVPDKLQLDGKLSDKSNKDLNSEARGGPSDIKDQATVATDEGNVGAATEEVADDSFRQADTSVTQETSDDILGDSGSGFRSAATTFDTAELESKLTIDDEGIDMSDQDASSQRILPVTSGIVSEPRIHAKESETIDRPYLGNETTCTTADGGDGNGGFERRLQQTMATFEGHMNTKEKDASEIQNTLSIIKNGKVRIHSANVWRYDPMTQEWSSAETLAYIGDKLKLGENEEGACRDAFMVEYVNQEEPMGRYVGKQYKLLKYKDNPRSIKQYKQDIICQVTSRYYVTLFNQEMYRKGLSFGQVQFLPAVLIELTDVENDPEKYYNVEPYMAGSFTKITNNFNWVVRGEVQGKDLLLAFSHFSYCSSEGKILIVDIQGWTSEDKTGGTFLTDPQIHTKNKRGFGTANRGLEGFKNFWSLLHPKCNDICKKLDLKRPNKTK